MCLAAPQTQIDVQNPDELFKRVHVVILYNVIHVKFFYMNVPITTGLKINSQSEVHLGSLGAKVLKLRNELGVYSLLMR